jgi:hypothetical protein
MNRTRPTMFIGSTVEALPVARAVQAELDYDIEITLWNQNVFEPGNATWVDLVAQARGEKFDLALLVLGAEDQIKSRGVVSNGPRDNVLLELGLFAGALGLDRTLFLIDRDKRPKIASDLAGITPLTYGSDRTDGNLQSAVGPACEQIRQKASKITSVYRNTPTVGDVSVSDTEARAILRSWVDREILDVLLRCHDPLEIDRRLRLPEGSTVRLMSVVVSESKRNVNVAVCNAQVLQLEERRQ